MKRKIKKRRNPLKIWCENVKITDSEWETLDYKYKSNVLLRQAYQGNGCWDLNKVLLAYVGTIFETKRLGKFPKMSIDLARKLMQLENFAMKEYIEMEYEGKSDFLDKEYFEFLKKHHALKNI